jgi:hypothetical protein
VSRRATLHPILHPIRRAAPSYRMSFPQPTLDALNKIGSAVVEAVPLLNRLSPSERHQLYDRLAGGHQSRGVAGPVRRPGEDVPKFLELTRQLPEFDQTGPWRHRTRDGTVFQVLITSHAIRFGPYNARLVIVKDPDQAPL